MERLNEYEDPLRGGYLNIQMETLKDNWAMGNRVVIKQNTNWGDEKKNKKQFELVTQGRGKKIRNRKYYQEGLAKNVVRKIPPIYRVIRYTQKDIADISFKYCKKINSNSGI